MKKILSLFLVISLVAGAFSACNNSEQTSAPTESAVTTAITTAAPTSQTAKTTSAYQTTIPTAAPLYTLDTIATSEERGKILFMVEENPLNEKVPSKVVITCGEERDVPYLVVGMGQYYKRFDLGWQGKTVLDGWVSFGGSRYIAEKAIKQNIESVPTFHCSSLDELIVHVNDVKVNIKEYILIDENGEEIEYSGSGRYYAYCTVTCKGPDVMQNGRKYDYQSIYYAAVFIVEITE